MSVETEGELLRAHKDLILRAANSAIHDYESRSAPLLLGNVSNEKLVCIQNDAIQNGTEQHRISQLRSERYLEQKRGWNIWSHQNKYFNISNPKQTFRGEEQSATPS